MRMKGLIIRDILCLKKQLTVFVFVLSGVVILSILYVLSAKFGNLSEVGRVLLDENNNMSPTDVKNLGTLALVLFLFLPIVTVGDMINVFAADGKAGFSKVSATFPILLKKRMLARFLTIYALLGIGVLIDLLLSALLSFLTDIMNFAGFFGIIISAASLLAIYSALAILFCTILGYGREQYAQSLSLLSILIGFILLKFRSMKEVIIRLFVEEQGFDSASFWKPLDFFREKGSVLFLIALLISAVSYCLSLIIAERKRGVL